jgi:hypothetical protein
MAESAICSEGQGFAVPEGGVLLVPKSATPVVVDQAMLAGLSDIKVPGASRVFLAEDAGLSRLTEQFLESMPTPVRDNIVLIWSKPQPGTAPDLAQIQQVSRHFQLPVHLPNSPGMAIPEGMTGSPALVPVDDAGQRVSFEAATGFRILPELLGPALETAPVVPLAPLPPKLTQPEGSNFTGRVLTVGKWVGQQETVRRQVHDLANASSRPVFQIGAHLNANDWRLLTDTARLFGMHGVTPTLVLLNDSPQVRDLAREFAAVTMRASFGALGGNAWTVQSPDGRERTFSGGLTRAVVAATDEFAVQSPWTVPQVLAEWVNVAQRDWRDAERFLAQNHAALTAPGIDGMLESLVERDTGARLRFGPRWIDRAANYLANDGVQDTTAQREPTPTALKEDATLTALRAAHRNAMQQPAGGGPVIEPQAPNVGTVERQQLTSLNNEFVFDYLTGRELAAEAKEPGASRILWDGLLFHAMVSNALTRADAVALARAVGDGPAEVAAAAVFEAVTLVIDSSNAASDLRVRSLVSAAEHLVRVYQCDIGPAQRLGWLTRLDHLGRMRPRLAGALDSLTNLLVNC